MRYMVKCKNCDHLRGYHDSLGVCRWKQLGAVRECTCDKFEYPPVPDRYTEAEALKIAVANNFCMDAGSIDEIKVVVEMEKGFATLLAVTIPVHVDKPLDEWIRENFWK